VREQGAIYLTTGSRLLSSRRDELAVITDDTCGRHDTIGGACSQESNTIRYGGTQPDTSTRVAKLSSNTEQPPVSASDS